MTKDVSAPAQIVASAVMPWLKPSRSRFDLNDRRNADLKPRGHTCLPALL